MKVYSITEGGLSHASTSITQNGASGKRKLIPNGTTDSRSRSAGHARGIETSDQAMGRAAGLVSSLRRKAAQTGRNDASGDRDCLWTGTSPATTFSLPGVSAALVSSQ